MRTSRTLKRWIALLLLAATTFAQASVALAGCELERRTVARLVAIADETACGCEVGTAGHGPLVTNRCFAHCTADLQIAGLAVAIVPGACDSAVLHLARPSPLAALRADPGVPAGDAVPIRILLHSFLI
jgi:hypothetical protein